MVFDKIKENMKRRKENMKKRKEEREKKREQDRILFNEYNVLVNAYENAKKKVKDAEENITCSYIIRETGFAQGWGEAEISGPYIKNQEVTCDEKKMKICIRLEQTSAYIHFAPEYSPGISTETFYCPHFEKDLSECEGCKFMEKRKKYQQAYENMKKCEEIKEKFWKEKINNRKK